MKLHHLNRRSDWPQPHTWPTNFGQKPPHFVSGKAIPDSGNIPLRPHEMTLIAHTEIGTRIVLQNPWAVPWRPAEGPACPLGRPTSADQRACHRGPHCTFPGSIAALLAIETRRRSLSVGNPLLPARAEDTSLWINPCTFRERRTCLPSSSFYTVRGIRPLRTWPALVFARLC